MSSSTSGDSNSYQNSSPGRGYALERSLGVTASNDDSIKAEDIVSLRHNEVDGIIREDTTFKNRVNETIIKELKTPKETEIVVE